MRPFHVDYIKMRRTELVEVRTMTNMKSDFHKVHPVACQAMGFISNAYSGFKNTYKHLPKLILFMARILGRIQIHQND